ncbi:MAG TPA: hypothetical protein VKK81_19410 [Candidatus Binatia bacterium]|nr:hypothetical protein [Candidatus Binatia bacterium]
MDTVRRFCVTLGMLAVLTVSMQLTLAAAQTQPTVDIDRSITLPYGPSWVVGSNASRNSVALYFVPLDTSVGAQARLVISTEHRRSRAEALRRVEQIAHNRRRAKKTFYVIGGWPTVERRYQAPLEIAGENEAHFVSR